MNGIWGEENELPLKWHEILGVCAVSWRDFTAFPRGVCVPEKLTMVLNRGVLRKRRNTKQG